MIQMHNACCCFQHWCNECHKGKRPLYLSRPKSVENSIMSLLLTCKCVRKEAEDIFFQAAKFKSSCCFPGRLTSRQAENQFGIVAWSHLSRAARFQCVSTLLSEPFRGARKTLLLHVDVVFSEGFQKVVLATPIDVSWERGRPYGNSLQSSTNMSRCAQAKSALMELLKLGALGHFRIDFRIKIENLTSKQPTVSKRPSPPYQVFVD